MNGLSKWKLDLVSLQNILLVHFLVYLGYDPDPHAIAILRVFNEPFQIVFLRKHFSLHNDCLHFLETVLTRRLDIYVVCKLERVFAARLYVN